MPRAMTKSEHDKIMLLLDHGLTRKQIRNLTGWSDDTITKVKQGMYSPDITDEPRRGRMTPDTLNVMEKLFAEGNSNVEVSRLTHLSDQVVKKAREGAYEYMKQQQPELIREAHIPAVMFSELLDILSRMTIILNSAVIVTKEDIK